MPSNAFGRRAESAQVRVQICHGTIHTLTKGAQNELDLYAQSIEQVWRTFDDPLEPKKWPWRRPSDK
jgi:hypothetical protein